MRVLIILLFVVIIGVGLGVVIGLVVRSNRSTSLQKTVNIKQGLVIGYLDEDFDLFEFHGIPYATAPTGTERFKPPLPPPTWEEPLEAIDRGIVCPQLPSQLPAGKVIQEDCLIANIFVPNTEESNLSVLIHIHGGAYQRGYGNKRLPKNLVKYKRAIVVNFNYRLGTHGFLCLGTEDIPGNAGSKDQVALLRWVKENIESFGGNPNDITVSGTSAGSSSADLMLVSKMTEGLFKGVILESGSNVAGFSTQTDPLEYSKMIARDLNFTNVDDTCALERFYKETPLADLFTIDVMERTDSATIFSPCIERELGQERFLDDSPVALLRSGNYIKVPLLYGFTEMEGMYRTDIFEVWKNMMNERFSDFLPCDLHFSSDEEREQVANRIKQFYFGNEPVSPINILRYVDYFTDVMFAHPALRAVKLQAEAGNNQVYLYEYSFADVSTEYIPYTEVRGASHSAQTIALFDDVNVQNSDESGLSAEYQQVKVMLRELWLNFINTGNPVPNGSDMPAWPPAGANRTPHMSLNLTMELRYGVLEESTRLLDEIYENYYRIPVAPPVPPTCS